MRRTIALVCACAMCSIGVGTGDAATMKQPTQRDILRGIVARQFAHAGGQAVRRAFCIVGRESQWNPRAVSSSGDYGLFQINYASWHRSFDWSRIKDPAYNTRVAWRLSRGGRDWSPWAGGRYAC